MSHRLLVVEHASSPLYDDWNAVLRHANLTIGRSSWDSFLPEQLQSCSYNLLLASAVPKCAEALNLFAWLRKNPVSIPIVVVLPAGDQEMLQAATGAVDDFVLTPVRDEELRQRLARLLNPKMQTLEDVQSALVGEMGLRQMAGKDPAFVRVLTQVAVFAASQAPALLTGETGTGKELCARVVHLLSKRRKGPFIPVDCGAVPDHLFENELFGHARGAFTDARTEQKGLVSLAEGGTLFIDEVDSLSLVAQSKVLRLLQERTYRPLGSESFRSADVRIITATNADIDALVQKKQFRADLFFRINVLRLHLPALRERRDDIQLLACHFIENLCQEGHLPVKALSPEAAYKLEQHDWPGNIRELHNAVQRAVLNSPGREISAAQFEYLSSGKTGSPAAMVFRNAKAQAIERFERSYVERLLRKHDGNITRAAREAGKDRRAFGRLAKKYGLSA